MHIYACFHMFSLRISKKGFCSQHRQRLGALASYTGPDEVRGLMRCHVRRLRVFCYAFMKGVCLVFERLKFFCLVFCLVFESGC